MSSYLIAQLYNLCLILLVSYEKITAHPIKLTTNIKTRQIINDMCDHNRPVRFSQSARGSGSARNRWLEWVHFHFKLALLPIVIKRKHHLELPVWNSRTVNRQAIVQVQIWLVSLRTVHWRNRCWVWETCLHEVLHFVFVSEWILFRCS